MNDVDLAADRPVLWPAHTPKHAVIVGGERARQTLLTLHLEDLGYISTICTTGSEVLFGSHARADLVITDLLLTDMFGTELARRIHRQSPSTRFLFVSSVEPEQWPRALFSPLRDVPPPHSYLRYPFTVRALREHFGLHKAA